MEMLTEEQDWKQNAKVPEESPLGAQRDPISVNFSGETVLDFILQSRSVDVGNRAEEVCLPQVNVGTSTLSFASSPKGFVTFYKRIAFIQTKLALTVMLMSLLVPMKWHHSNFS